MLKNKICVDFDKVQEYFPNVPQSVLRERIQKLNKRYSKEELDRVEFEVIYARYESVDRKGK